MDKNRLITFLLLLLTNAAIAQADQTPISRDPVFIAVLKQRIKYPVLAEQTGVYARVYVRFLVNEKGHVQQITLLQPAQTKDGFERAVLVGMRHLPPLNPRYEGQYILPVDFAYINYESSPDLLLPPTGTLPRHYTNDYLLLYPIRIVGNNRAYSPKGSNWPTPLNSPGRQFF